MERLDKTQTQIRLALPLDAADTRRGSLAISLALYARQPEMLQSGNNVRGAPLPPEENSPPTVVFAAKTTTTTSGLAAS